MTALTYATRTARQNRALDRLDRLVHRCPTCDARILPARLMRTPHVCLEEVEAA